MLPPIAGVPPNAPLNSRDPGVPLNAPPDSPEKLINAAPISPETPRGAS